jgi:formate-dependent nitrite reductase membrane component NrfD
MTMFENGSEPLAYGITAAVAVAGFVLYLRTVGWPYLVVGVLGVTLVVPEAVMHWTDGSLGVAGAVLVAGLTLLGASLAGLRMRQEVGERDPEETADRASVTR